MKVADLLLRDGNLPLILLDLQPVPIREVRRIPASALPRFQRLIEPTGTGFVRIVEKKPQPDGSELEEITWKRASSLSPDEILSAFRNSYNPRIAVTVDMIATGPRLRQSILQRAFSGALRCGEYS